jgi:acyl-CoA reductase-like NAD-dependent aldehyde dehydrogenase
MTVWKDAKLDDNLLQSSLDAFLGSSQICMVPKIFLIHHAIYDKYIEFIIKNIGIVKAGLPEDEDVYLSPVGKMKDYDAFLENALSNGARIATGGKRIDYKGGEDQDGLFIQPTVLNIDNVAALRKTMCYNSEIFFPLIPMVRLGNVKMSDADIMNEAIDAINDNPFGLRASIWIKDKKLRQKFVDEVDMVGSIRVNSRHIGFSRFMATHGGTGNSGGPLGELNYGCLRAGHLQGISIRNG